MRWLFHDLGPWLLLHDHSSVLLPMGPATRHICNTRHGVRRLGGVIHQIPPPLLHSRIHTHRVGVGEIHHRRDAGKTVGPRPALLSLPSAPNTSTAASFAM